MADSVTSLPVDQLQPNPFQPRDKIKKADIEQLTKSVSKHGVLEPLVIAQTPAGYQIIAGERRWRAAKEAGMETVPVHVKKTTPKGMLEMALIENVQRSDLSPIERAQAFQQLMRDFDLTMVEVADRISKSPAYVSNSIRLLKLPDAVKDGLVGGEISEGHARALMGILDEQEMVRCYKETLKKGLSVRQVEAMARSSKERTLDGNKPLASKRIEVPPEQIHLWESQMQRTFKSPTKLALSRSFKHTRITITIKGAPHETQSDLDKLINSLAR